MQLATSAISYAIVRERGLSRCVAAVKVFLAFGEYPYTDGTLFRGQPCAQQDSLQGSLA